MSDARTAGSGIGRKALRRSFNPAIQCDSAIGDGHSSAGSDMMHTLTSTHRLTMRLIATLLFSLLAMAVSAGEVLKYEPEVVRVTGTIAKGKHEHPNGTWFDV